MILYLSDVQACLLQPRTRQHAPELAVYGHQAHVQLHVGRGEGQLEPRALPQPGQGSSLAVNQV